MASSLAFAGFNPIFISNRHSNSHRGTKLFKSKSVPVSATKSKTPSRIKKQVNKLKIARTPTSPLPHLKTQTPSHHSSETSEESFSESQIERTPEIITDQSAIYLLLTKQRDEAILQNEKLENRAQEQELEFAFKLSSFKKQLKQYKYTNNELIKENENLKSQIAKLKERLSLFSDQNNLKMLKRKKVKKNALSSPRKKQQQLHNFVKKDYANKPDEVMKLRPFIHSRSTTEKSDESSLTARAVNLSLPHIKPPLTHIRHLTTIMEHKSVPLGILIADSSENDHIESEWSEHSVADIIERKEQEEEEEEEEEEQTVTHSVQRSVSYMSNNTMMLNDLQLEPLLVDDEESENVDSMLSDDDKVSKNTVSPPPIFTQRKESMIFDGEEDEIIKSPIELNKNMAFNIRAN